MSEQAGRELDALIAEKVMGTPKYWSVWFACSHYGNFSDLAKAQAYAEKIQGDFKAHVIPYSDEPNYSTSIEVAWEVVEKITTDFTGVSSKGFGIGFKMEYCTETAGPNYQVTLVETSCAPPFEEMRDICTVVAGTAPLAICLAALKVVGA